MPRTKRKNFGGYFYHVLNRANGRLRIFKKQGDFEAFEQTLAEGQQRTGMRICGYCVMGNHWHLLLWPREDGDLSTFMQWVTLTHTQRYHASHGTTGMGHVYQGRYKSFPVQGGNYYHTLMRYIEANPLRAELVKNAADWPWSSYAYHIGKMVEDKPLTICKSPRVLPGNWSKIVHKGITESETETIRNAIKRGCPMGGNAWIAKATEALGLEATLKPIGRPKLEKNGPRYL
jgi:putative transposase